MKILYSEGVIALTKKEMKEASVFGSDMYKNLMEARHDNPSFHVEEIKPKRAKTALDSLDMAAIRVYVKEHGTEAQKDEFLRISIGHYTEEGIYIEAQSFFDIKKWFLAEFPEYKNALENHEAETRKIFDAVDAKIAAAKAEAIKAAREMAVQEATDFLMAS